MRTLLLAVCVALALPAAASSDWGAHPYATDLAWSPDGRRLAFTWIPDPGFQPAPIQLVVASATPGDEHVVWEGETERVQPHPSWSPDGRLLAFQKCCTSILVVPAAGGQATTLTPFDDVDGYPRFSPDGSVIAFVTTRPHPDPGPYSLAVMKPDGSDRHAIAPAAAPVNDQPLGEEVPTPLDWAPDGKSIAYVSTGVGSSPAGVYLVAAAGGEARPLTGARSTASAPRFSRDGRRVAWAFGTSESVRRMESVAIDGSDDRVARMPTVGRIGQVEPVWGPGRDIVTADTRGLILVTLDGKVRRLLGPGSDPAWSPDGTRIAFAGSDDCGPGVLVLEVANGRRTRAGRDCHLRGSSRKDVLTGTALRDVIDAKGGNDTVRAAGGDDRIAGGPGRDRIFAGSGPDYVKARDGERDVVDCGPGRDIANVDAADVVRGCERVVRAAR